MLEVDADIEAALAKITSFIDVIWILLEDGGVVLDEGAAARGCGEDVAGAGAELRFPAIDVALDELQALLLLIEVPVHGAAAVGFGAGAGYVEFAKDGGGSGVGVGGGD